MQPITFTPTADDLPAAYRVQISSGFRSRKMLQAYIGGGIVLAMFGWMISSDSRALVSALTAAGAALFWCIMLTLMVAVQWLMLPGRVRRVYAQQKSLHDPIEVSWDETGIELRSSRGDSRFGWGDFTKAAESRDTILLFQSDLLFNFLPKRTLSEEQATQVMAYAVAATAPGRA